MSTERAVFAAVEQLLAQPSPDAAVALLRTVEQSPEALRSIALDRLDAHLRSSPEKRARPVVDAVVALRRVGGAL